MYFRVILSIASLLLYAGTASAAPFAYIANKADDTVSVLDTASNAVVKVLTVGDAPSGVAVNRMGSRVYVANEGDSTISVIDTLDDSITSVSVGAPPGALAVNAAGTRLFVANPANDSVSIISTVSKTLIVAPIAMSASCQPQGIAVGPADGSGNYRAFVSCYGTDKVAIIAANDTGNAYAASTELIVPGGPRGIAVSADGTKVYVAGMDSDSLTSITNAQPLATPATGNTITVGPSPWGVAIDPSVADSANTTRLYVANSEGTTVSVVDSVNGVIALNATPAVTVGQGPRGVAFTADGTKAVASNYFSFPGTISVITGTSAATTTGGTFPDPVIGDGPSSFGNFVSTEQVAITTGVNDYNCGSITTPEVITPDNDVYLVAKGKNVLFNINTFLNCVPAAVQIDGAASIGTPATYTFVAPVAAHDIYASFTRIAWIIAVSKSGLGTGTVTSLIVSGPGYETGSSAINCGTGAACSTTIKSGTRVRLTASPGSGSAFDGWLGYCGAAATTCDLTVDASNALLFGGEAGTFSTTALFRTSGGPVRTNRGGTEKFFQTLQTGCDGVAAATAANPVDLNTSMEYTILFDKPADVYLVGGWTAYVTGGGTLSAGSASIINNGAAGVIVQYGSVTIGSWGGNGAIIIK